MSDKLNALVLNTTGRMQVAAGAYITPENVMQAMDAELANAGYVLSYKLRARMATLHPTMLARQLAWVLNVVLTKNGGVHFHQPLFRQFPQGVPSDTFDLWCRKVIGYWFQEEDAPCLTCGAQGSTHVLRPCYHVVCDKCFDGSNYSGCPICERPVDQSSPFFKPTEVRLPSRRECAALKVLDLCEGDVLAEVQKLFTGLCARKQALSPDDKETLTVIVQEADVLGWLPAEIPLKENVAVIFGELLKAKEPDLVLDAARKYLKTATDMLRLLAVYSGADASLQGQQVTYASKLAPRPAQEAMPKRIKRFQVGKMGRGLRRAVLAFLDDIGETADSFERMLEDMLRHQSYWVWLGEFLHPYEYARRYPQAALGFAVVRGTKGTDSTLTALLQQTAVNNLGADADGEFTFETFAARLEAAARSGDGLEFTRIVSGRPGELARRVDHALRLTVKAGQATDPVVTAFCGSVHKFSTPVLMTLFGYLPARTVHREDAPSRLIFPKGEVSMGVAIPETRDALPQAAVFPMVKAIQKELLRRFGEKPRFQAGVVDRGLQRVIVPFNERTASRSDAMALTRGSVIPVKPGHTTRLFLHWCEPESGDYTTTDLDLSVGFFDKDWNYKGVCSFYELECKLSGRSVARSAGDLRAAPHPDGATEFVDIDIEQAKATGIRYAVMVVNAWSGLSFDKLQRAYAGVMERADVQGQHFDPRTVSLKFALQGDNGAFTPMVLDIQKGEIHWMDVYQKGRGSMNSVETSREKIAESFPQMMAYFASGVRMSMYDLGLLHAAGRCDTVYVRDDGMVQRFDRRTTEEVADFYRRIVAGDADSLSVNLPELTQGAFACLVRGNVNLPQGSTCYALAREQQTAVIAASDLLS